MHLGAIPNSITKTGVNITICQRASALKDLSKCVGMDETDLGE